MTVTGTLEQIRAKVRLITGRPSINQLSDADLDNYINDFYVYDMPAHLKLWNLKNVESPLIPTTPGGDDCLTPGRWNYAINFNKYNNISPPFYIGGYEVAYFQDVRSFLNYFPARAIRQDFATGSGIAGPYAGTITATPILTQGIFFSVQDAAGNTLTATANDAGTITGDVLAGGTVNYITGAVAGLTWTAAIPAGNIITVQTLIYTSARPLAVLFYNNILLIYPVPDIAYEIYCNVDYAPDELGPGDQPEIRQWWNLIAMGAALKIFTDNLDVESYAKLRPLFDEQKRLVERRTLKQLSNQRVSTIYDYQTNFINNFFGFTNV